MQSSDNNGSSTRCSTPNSAIYRRKPLVIVSLGLLLVSFSLSSIGLAIPFISREFTLDISGSSWIMLSLLVTTTSLLLIAGRAGDIYGHRFFFITGYFVLAFSALVNGFALNAPMLFAGRVIQGFGSAMILTASPALISLSCPPGERGKALGILSTCVYAGLMLGPPAGGYILSYLGWRSIFFLTVPLALFTAITGGRMLSINEKISDEKMDWRGIAALIAGIPLLLVSIYQAPRWGWTSPITLIMFAIGLISIILFLLIEQDSEHPILELKLFKSRMFTGSAVASVANYTALTFSSFLMPFFLIEGLNLNSSTSGFLMAMQPFTMAVVSVPSGWMSDRIGSRGPAVTGMLLISAALVGLSFVSLHGNSQYIVAIFLGIMGLGTGIFITPNTNALLNSAPVQHQGTASGVLAFARNFGMLLGTALSAYVFQAWGGDTGQSWDKSDLTAFRVSMITASLVTIIGAATSAIKGNERSS